MKGSVIATLEAPVRIIAVRRKRVTVEMPDGERISLREGDTLNVRITGDFKIGKD